MPRYCSVPTCGNNDIMSPDDVFHFLPDGEDRKAWVRKCQFIDKWETLGIKPFYSTVAETVCSQHFRSSDYLNAAQSIAGSLERKLKSDAIPSLNLPPSGFMKYLHSGKHIRNRSSSSQAEKAAKRQLNKLQLQTGSLQPGLDAKHQEGKTAASTDHSISNAGEAVHVLPDSEGTVLPKESCEEENTGFNKRKPEFVCNHCSLALANEVSLKEHLIRAHLGEFAVPFPCGVCKKAFDNRLIHKKHESSHEEKMMEQGSSDRKSSLRVLKEKPFVCHVCLRKFHSKEDLDVHVELHNEPHKSGHPEIPKKSFECGLCDFRFMSRNRALLKKHAKLHQGKPFTCDFCERMFTSEENLQEHVTCFHSATLLEKGRNVRFQCSVCNKSFAKLCTLKNHRRVHTATSYNSSKKSGETVLRCNVCSSKFEHEIDFSTHSEQAHANMSARSCKSSFERKMESGGDAQFACKVCSNKFEREVDFNVHFERAHADTSNQQSKCGLFFCDLCELSFQKRRDLNKHLAKSHAVTKLFLCHICGKRFHRYDDRSNHQADHMVSPYFKCGLCKKRLVSRSSIEKHFRISHAGFDPWCFFCALCGDRFCDSKTLLRHHVIKHVQQELPYEPARLSEPVLMNISLLCNVLDMYILC